MNTLKAADVGAGTGIFTKCLLDAGVQNVTAVEPNDDMRKAGIEFLGRDFDFLVGSAEKTGLLSKSFDLVTMASSFHWPNTEKALQEFDRALSAKGVFCALWNPRLTERSACENEVQELLAKKYKVASRVSSGLSGITQELREILTDCGIFKSVIYVDAVDTVQRSHEEYIGAWRSVNDVQAQLGKEKFQEFIEDVEKIIKKINFVEVHYLTRAWIACK
jgi:ubiquinone/menaquinone biosynthesis C-methylase UbiE